MVREWCFCKSLPNECSSLFWQERPGSQSTTLSFWGPGPGWGGRSQLAAPSGPGPQTLHNCYHWGSQVPRMQPTLRFLRLPKWWGPGPIECVPCGLPLPLGQRWGGGRGSPTPQGLGQGQQVALARALEPCRTQPPACSLGPQSTPAGPRPGKLERRIHVLPHCPPEDHHSTAPRLLAESSQLTVSPRQPVACGRGSLQCWPMTEQDRQTVSDSWLLVGGAHCSVDQSLSRAPTGPMATRVGCGIVALDLGLHSAILCYRKKDKIRSPFILTLHIILDRG